MKGMKAPMHKTAKNYLDALQVVPVENKPVEKSNVFKNATHIIRLWYESIIELSL